MRQGSFGSLVCFSQIFPVFFSESTEQGTLPSIGFATTNKAWKPCLICQTMNFRELLFYLKRHCNLVGLPILPHSRQKVCPLGQMLCLPGSFSVLQRYCHGLHNFPAVRPLQRDCQLSGIAPYGQRASHLMVRRIADGIRGKAACIYADGACFSVYSKRPISFVESVSSK